jgi:hypothetical protein
MMNFAWATEQTQVSPGAKLLAVYIANYSAMREEIEIRLEDAAAWCCTDKIEEVDIWFKELETHARLFVLRHYAMEDKYDTYFVVRIPGAINGGNLI